MGLNVGRWLLLLVILLTATGALLLESLRAGEHASNAAGFAASHTATPIPVEPAAREAAKRADQGGPGEVVPGFGGLFLDPQDNSIVYVYLLDTTQREAAWQAARALLGDQAIREVRILQGRYTMGQLSAWYDRTRDVVWSVAGVQWTDLDEGHNRIALGLAPRPGAREEIEAALTPLDIPRDAVHIEAGCPVGAPYAPPAKPGPGPQVLDVRLETPSRKVGAGQPVTLRLVVKNTSAEPVKVEYGLGSRFVVTRLDGSTVWDSRCGAGVIPAIAMVKTLAPGQELTYLEESSLAGTWRQWDNRGTPVAPGTYRVYGVFDTYPELASAPQSLSIEAAP